MMSAAVVDLANARTQRAAAAAAARAASDAVELAVMHAVKQMLDKLVQDKAAGRTRRPDEYVEMLREFSKRRHNR